MAVAHARDQSSHCISLPEIPSRLEEIAASAESLLWERERTDRLDVSARDGGYNILALNSFPLSSTASMSVLPSPRRTVTGRIPVNALLNAPEVAPWPYMPGHRDRSPAQAEPASSIAEPEKSGMPESVRLTMDQRPKPIVHLALEKKPATKPRRALRPNRPADHYAPDDDESSVEDCIIVRCVEYSQLFGEEMLTWISIR
jgi:hypothetical protein